MAVSRVNDIKVFRNDQIEYVNNLIGNGGMGIVSSGIWKFSDPVNGIRWNDEVAIKRLEIASSIDVIKQEAKMLWRLHEDCDYILRLYGLLESDCGICLLLEYMKYGNISDFFYNVLLSSQCQDAKEKLWPLKLRIVKQVCCGMAFLHSRKILHCDLKAANVLLDDNLNVKICDFGLAKIKQLTTKPSSNPEGRKDKELNNNPAGTVSHVAPELLHVNKSPTRSSDVYSFGIFLWEILTDMTPYRDASSGVLIIKDVHEGKRPDLSIVPNDCPTILRNTMTQAWQQDPVKRPQFSDINTQLQRENISSRDIEDSVLFAIHAWNQMEFPSETIPKEIDSSPCNSKDVHWFSEPYSFPTENERLQQHIPPLQPNNIQTAEPRSMLRSDEVLLSEDVYETSSNDCGSSRRFLIDEEQGTSNKKNFTQSPEVIIRNPEVQRSSCSYFKSTVTHVLVGVVVAAVAFTVMYFVSPYLVAKGCCLKCFNQNDSNLISSCSRQSSKGDVAPPDSFCTFNCSHGFVLNGRSARLQCDNDGVWSGPLPYCRKIRQCSALPDPANGGSVQCTNEYFENTKCTFQCPEGTEMKFVGPDQSTTITCQQDDIANFYWTDEVPYCEKVVQCDPPTTDDKVEVNCGTSKSGEYYNGTTCQFACKIPMSLQGNDSVGLCQDDGNWNVTSKITCFAGCPNFRDPLNSSHICLKGHYETSRCTFSCDANFTMVGSNNMVCHNGRWLNPPPRCECPACRSGIKCSNTVNFAESWEELNSTKEVVYDGHRIICADMEQVYMKKQNSLNKLFGCQCRDRISNHNKQCNHPASYPEACKKAFASLILILAYNGTMTLPCDAEIMPLPC